MGLAYIQTFYCAVSPQTESNLKTTRLHSGRGATIDPEPAPLHFPRVRILPGDRLWQLVLLCASASLALPFCPFSPPFPIHDPMITFDGSLLISLSMLARLLALMGCLDQVVACRLNSTAVVVGMLGGLSTIVPLNLTWEQ